MENITKYLKINFLVSLSKNLTGVLTTLLLLPIVIIRIGIENYGIVSLTMLFSGVSSIADLGVSKAVITLIGEKKVNENRVVTSAVVINAIVVIVIISLFTVSQLFSVDLLGDELNLRKDEQITLLYVSLLILIFALINNLGRAILEAKYLLHIVNLTFAIYSPLLYGSIIVLSFFTMSNKLFMVVPLVVTILIFLINIYFLQRKTTIRLCKVNAIHLKYLLKNVIGFLNLGLLNSMIIPALRYFFILKVTNTGLYGVLDLAFKIAQSGNGFIVSIATPMLAVFSHSKKHEEKSLIKLSYKIFFISICLLILASIGFYLVGEELIGFLSFDVYYKGVLYDLSFFLLVSIGAASSVEVFVRYYMGNKMLLKIFVLKLLVPLLSVLFYFSLLNLDYIHRIVYSYGIALIISAVFIFISFKIKTDKFYKS